MKKLIIVTESNAILPVELVQKLDIRVVPILLSRDGRYLILNIGRK